MNVLAVIVAAVSVFLLGGPWYSKALFGLAWGRAAGFIVDGQPIPQKQGHPARVFAVSFVFALAAAFAFAWLIGPAPPLAEALTKGALVGGAFVATSFGINYQFANRPTVMWLIDGGYHFVQFAIYGLILGLWH